jgi:signal transduction histidine kinase
MDQEILVYIVDDETYNRDIAARLIRKMGHAHREFPSGTEFLAGLAEQTPDIVLLDIHMPEMNGLEVLTEIRKELDKTELPVLMITADSEADTVVKAFELGANDYVTKPINAKTLRARIDTHLNLKAASEQIKEYTRGAESLVAQCTMDIQKRNEDLAREVRLRMDTEESLIAQKLAAEKAYRDKSDFLASLINELRTPLSVAVGFAELVAKDGPDGLGHKQCHEYGGYILNSTRQLLNLVDDVYTVSHYDAGKLTIEETEVDVATLLENAGQNARPAPAEKNMALNISCAEGLQLIGDYPKLERAVRNLVSNAVKYSSKDSVCDVSASLNDNLEVILSIKDNGPGMPEHIDMASDDTSDKSAFASDDQTEGLGLGLPVVQTVMNLHGAVMTINSSKDDGTTITLRFPPERTIIASAEKATA